MKRIKQKGLYVAGFCFNSKFNTSFKESFSSAKKMSQIVAGSAPAIFFGNWFQECTNVRTTLVLPHPLHYFLVVNLSLSLNLTSYGRRQMPTYGTEMFVSLESVAKDSTECEGELTPYTPGSPTPRAAAVTNPAVSNFR